MGTRQSNRLNSGHQKTIVKLATALFTASLVTVVGLALYIFPLNRHEVSYSAEHRESANDASRVRADRLAKFHNEKRAEILERIVDGARKDPSYRKALMATTEKDLMSLTRFSIEERRQMWERTRDAQEAIRAAGLGD